MMTEMSKTRIVKRRFLTAEQKMILVQESYEPMKTVAEIARKGQLQSHPESSTYL